MGFKTAFSKWLNTPEPAWKQNVDLLDDSVFTDIKMSKEELVELLEKLEEYELFTDAKMKK